MTGSGEMGGGESAGCAHGRIWILSALVNASWFEGLPARHADVKQTRLSSVICCFSPFPKGARDFSLCSLSCVLEGS